MRNIFFILISLGLALTVHAEDFAKILDGTSFLVPMVSEQPRGTVRTALTGFNGYYDGTHLRNEDALVFAQRFAPRWTRLQFGYALAFQESSYSEVEYVIGAQLELPIRLSQDESLATAALLSVNSSYISYRPEAFRSAAFSLPLRFQVWPRLRATAFAGFGYRSVESSYKFGVHPYRGENCHPEPEQTWVHPRGGALEYAAHRNFHFSLEYLRSTYYSFNRDYRFMNERWTEVRQSIAPGLRFTSGEWSLAAGFPYTLSGKTAAEGLIFNLAFQPVGRSRQ